MGHMEGRGVVSAMRKVLLYGHILGESKKEPGVTIIEVDPMRGHAKEFGIAGQVRVLDRQCIEFNRGGTCDVIALPEHVARSLSKRANEPPPPEKTKRRRPRR